MGAARRKKIINVQRVADSRTFLRRGPFSRQTRFGFGSAIQSAVWVQSVGEILWFQMISHPPYSPDLASMDFSVFPAIKNNSRDIVSGPCSNFGRQGRILFPRLTGNGTCLCSINGSTDIADV